MNHDDSNTLREIGRKQGKIESELKQSTMHLDLIREGIWGGRKHFGETLWVVVWLLTIQTALILLLLVWLMS